MLPRNSWVRGVVGVVLACTLALSAWKTRAALNAARAEAATAWAALGTGKVTLAAAKADQEHYRVLFEQAARLRGKPVAGVVLTLPRRDTVWRHDTLPTQLLPDSTRVARFVETTTDGVTVRATLTAPPCCAALQAEVQVQVPAETLSVGFVQVGTKVVAVARSRTREVSVAVPFFVPAKQPRWSRFVEVLGDPEAVTVRGGTALRLYRQFAVTAVLDQRFAAGEATRVLAGVRYTF